MTDTDDWLNAPVTAPDSSMYNPAIVSWLDMLRRNDDPSWDAMGGNELIEDGEIDGEPMTPEQMVQRQADIIMEEWSPMSLRYFLLNEYDLADRGGHGLGSERFMDDVEEHIMGYPKDWDFASERENASRQDTNFTSKDPIFTASEDTLFESAWDTMKNAEKGKFRGYSRDRISGRAERQAKARAWSQSRKVKRGRARKRYARNKKRGNVRPQMRRQLGAGGKREQVKR